MAKICAAFYNGLYDATNINKIPAWYESFYKGLIEYGNELLLFPIREWQKEYGEIDPIIKKKVLEFEPDLYISFNNVFYDMSFLDCPKLIYGVDSVIYWMNKSRLKGEELFAVYGKSEVKLIQSLLGYDAEKIHVVRPFTSVKNDVSVPQTINISFIGSRFGVDRKNELGVLENESQFAREEYASCLEYIIKHPLATKEEVITANSVTNERVREMIDVPGMVMMMSAEKRVRVLSAIVDLGLNLYGTRNWMSKYHFDTRINASFIDKEIYSIAHNAKIYNESKIGINISHLQATEGFSWRVLDIMASNACLVTDSWSGVKEFFPKLPIPVYEDEHEARELCKELLSDESKRKGIVRECQKIVESEYRFVNHIVELENITKISLRGKTTGGIKCQEV